MNNEWLRFFIGIVAGALLIASMFFLLTACAVNNQKCEDGGYAEVSIFDIIIVRTCEKED